MKRMRSWWSWAGRQAEEVSPWVGFSLGGLYVAAVVVVGFAGVHYQRHAVAARHLADARQWTYLLSRDVANAQSAGLEAVSHELRQAAHEPDVTFCEVVSDEGVILAHSQSSQVGQPALAVSFADEAPARARVGRIAGQPDELVLVSRMASLTGGATPNMLRVGFTPARVSWSKSGVAFCAGYVLLAVLGLFLLIYRLLRRSVQPLAVIRSRLEGCGESIADRVSALRLNDSYDQISASWNRLIEFVTETQSQVQASNASTDVTAAIDGYRSERLSSLLMQIPFGVVLVDEEGVISFANRAATGMLGREGESLEGQSAEAVFEPGLRTALLSATKGGRSVPGSGSRWIDHTYDRPNNPVTLRFWSSPSDGGGGEQVIFVQDVTQAKQAELARDQFLYHVTHELRTPLTNIRAYSETLSQGVIDDERTIRECYNVIMGETGRLSRLVENMLSVSQLEVGTARLDTRELALGDLLRKVVQDNQGSADAKSIDLVLRLPPKPPRVSGDRDRLAVVFGNLVGNAIKYTPGGGRVEVTCTAEPGRVEIAVSDTGLGIAPEHQDRVFDKFYRVDDEQVAQEPGTGLGLAIVKETVRVHGGSVRVTSTPGQGSTFTVTLPAMAVDESSPETQGVAAKEDA